ncbi:endonuclease/exonuclease/phosphatase family protein [Paenibacillus sp. NPDC057934]|uniref:endonuclease/exonuclease/phosphatase family protein n=1 Tax=Paenibacillus sp. NPDC057934 TaxID=3346282 RepID=UPI0036D8F664
MGISILKIIGGLCLALVLALGCFLVYVTVTDYKPAEVTPLTVFNNSGSVLQQGQPLQVTTFNIGYAGLDAGQDFFMDGGSMARSSSKAQTVNNLEQITSFLKTSTSDIYLLQEVDVKSSRSYKVNEVSYITSEMPDYSHVFALNYLTPWVPLPVLHPMGSVQSGLLTLAKPKSSSQLRYDLPGKESWPYQLFELDRAFIESRFPVDNGKELVILNVHLSAYDKGGHIRKQQLEYLSAYIEKESQHGNYLIIGGDWNHTLPGTDSELFETTQGWPAWLQPFPADFLPEGFHWAVDHATPSVRTLDVPYSEGVNFRAVIDGFLVSPNVEVTVVQGQELNFANSDHNPVTAQFVLK